MHIYRHHIGDYDSATAHLTWSEDMAYTRILRLYYRNDGVLPVCTKAICRLVRASSKEERAAVETVLNEFFSITDDGWKNKRADEEIAEYQAGAEEREQKKTHENERMRRHREERSRLFSDLRERGITPKWDIGIAELKALHARTCNEPETNLQREQEHGCNEPATANHNQEPRTKNQEPRTKREREALPAVAGRPPAGTRLPDDWIPDVLFAVSEGFTEFDARTEGEKFRDYWRSQPGARGRKADWQATWRNWIRRAGEDKRKPTTHPGSGSFVQRHTSADWRVGL